MKPRIAILHYASPPTIGGVESTIAAHARLFADRGYPVKVITGRGQVFDSRVPVTVLPEIGSTASEVLEINAQLAQGCVTAKFDSLVRRLVPILATELGDQDVLMAHNVLSLHKNLALTAAIKGLITDAVRVIAWCHDLAWCDPQYAGEMHSGYPWDLLREQWPQVQYVVVSRARQEDLSNLWHKPDPEARISVVPPGIDPIEFLGVSDEAAHWVHDLDLLNASPLLLLPARLTRRKNIEFAVQVTAALRKRGTTASLIVTGPPGPHNPTNEMYLDRLRRLRKELAVENAVIFMHEHGEIKDAALRDLYLLADAMILPSTREGFGIPVLEAGLARLPVFCTDLACFHESAGKNARYFLPDASPESVADLVLETLAGDPAYRLKRRVLQEYSWDKIFSERIRPLIDPEGTHV